MPLPATAGHVHYVMHMSLSMSTSNKAGLHSPWILAGVLPFV